MVITNTQFQQLGNIIFDSFINTTLKEISTKYPEWKTEETEQERLNFIKKLIQYAQKKQITQSNNLMKFLDCLISQKLELPLLPILESELLDSNISESLRVELLYLKIIGGRYKLNMVNN